MVLERLKCLLLDSLDLEVGVAVELYHMELVLVIARAVRCSVGLCLYPENVLHAPFRLTLIVHRHVGLLVFPCGGVGVSVLYLC